MHWISWGCLREPSAMDNARISCLQFSNMKVPAGRPGPEPVYVVLSLFLLLCITETSCIKVFTDTARSQLVSRAARENGVLLMDLFPVKSFSMSDQNIPVSDPTTPTQTPAEFTQHRCASPGSLDRRNPFVSQEEYALNVFQPQAASSSSVSVRFLSSCRHLDIHVLLQNGACESDS
jgi:hypothetical protein